MPLVKYLYNGFHAKVQLYRMMKNVDPQQDQLLRCFNGL